MELYYAPLACSLASHVVCLEGGLDVRLRRVDLATKRVDGGGDLRALNALGQVPVLALDDGRTLTENVAVLSWLGRRAELVPEPATEAGDETLRWLGFVATEVHRRVTSVVFSRDAPGAVKAYARAAAVAVLGVVERHVATRDALVGEFGVADAYLVWALTILPFGGVELAAFPSTQAYQARHATRASVREAFARERAEYARR